MRKFDIAQTLSIAANLGVVVGIIFLAIEVGQNQASLEEANKINRIAAREAAYASVTNFRLLLAGNEDVARIFLEGQSGKALSPIEALRFGSLCNEIFWGRAISYERDQALGSTEAARAAIDSIASQVANSPGLKECWDQQKVQMTLYGMEAFVAAVDAIQE